MFRRVRINLNQTRNPRDGVEPRNPVEPRNFGTAEPRYFLARSLFCFSTIAATSAPVSAIPAVNTGSSVAIWTGDDATFTLQGLRLARVNGDLAENLGRGSEGGFLILDTGHRWSGLRAGDVLLEVDGRPVRDGNTARIALDDGDDHSAEVIREGRRRTVSVDVR